MKTGGGSWLPSGLLVREDVEPGPHGFPPDRRPLDLLMRYGVVKLDKPSGPTSHTVTRWVGRILGVRRVGHCGTLATSVGEIPR